MRGESEMDKLIINIKSITHAHKAQKLLYARRIASNIKKSINSDNTSGCGYSLIINNGKADIVSFLEKNGIPIISVRNGRDEV